MLNPGAFPTLRYSVFAGEALPWGLAEAWQAAAPHSVVENLYGPTEATVYCIGATFGPDFPATPERGTVPSGYPLPGLEAAIFDDALRILQTGQEGQLAISGGQVAAGYFNEATLTEQRFPTISGKTWYLTGDLARQDERGIFHHLGRIDNQVKVFRSSAWNWKKSRPIFAPFPPLKMWPPSLGRSKMVLSLALLPSQAASRNLPKNSLMPCGVPSLPTWCPDRFFNLDALPLNPSGKIDRKSLARYLDESTSKREASS